MNQKILRGIEHYNPKVVVLDIDGTLKDLCKEHSEAVRIILQECNVGRIKRKVILAINRIAMSIVKTGMLPTNRQMQNILVKVFAVLAGINVKVFYDKYFETYTSQLYLFNGVSELLSLLNSEKKVYFATINKQNYNLGACGITQERIVYTEGTFKQDTYAKLLKSIGAEAYEVLIVGDNIFDDFLSAKRLKVKCLLVNNYNSKLKSVICKLVNGKYLR